MARKTTVGDSRCVRFSVATDYFYKDRDNQPVCEITWHQVLAWEGKSITEIDNIDKGARVHVTGRLRQQRYTAADGTERISYEIIANSVEIIEE